MRAMHALAQQTLHHHLRPNRDAPMNNRVECCTMLARAHFYARPSPASYGLRTIINAAPGLPSTGDTNNDAPREMSRTRAHTQ
jgi:hypothetical protein